MAVHDDPAEKVHRLQQEVLGLAAELRHVRIKRNALLRHAWEQFEVLRHALEHVESCELQRCPECVQLAHQALGHTSNGSFLMAEDLDDAVEALESMASQYLAGDPKTGYNHDFMRAGELATAVLCRLRPQDWTLTPTGMEPATPRDTDPHIQRILDREMVPFTPDWTIAPGEVLADWARERGLSADQAAQQVAMDLPDYLALICGERVITRDLADSLEANTGISAKIWARLEQSFRIGLAVGLRWGLASTVVEGDEGDERDNGEQVLET